MAPKLKVEIRETVTLSNNNKYDAYNRYTLNGINHIDKRMIRVPTGGTEIITLSGSIGAGAFKPKDVRYMRFTNLSEVNPIMMELKNEDGDSFVTKIGQGLSFIYSGDHLNEPTTYRTLESSSGITNTMDANTSSSVESVINIASSTYAGLGSLVNVVAKASGSSEEYTSGSGTVYNVDMEIFIAAV